jgi:hypothetical protein
MPNPDPTGPSMPVPEEINPLPVTEPGSAAQPAAGPGFLRLRLRWSEGRLHVVSARFVDGGHPHPVSARSGHVCELRVGDRSVATGNVPDLGVRRSFPDPQGPPERQVHHLGTVAEPEFNLQVPAGALQPDEMDAAVVTLYDVSAEAAAAGPLLRLHQRPQAAQPIAATDPGDLARLPDPLTAEIRRAAEAPRA